MRRPFIAGNWKMNLNKTQAVQLAKGVAAGLDSQSGTEVAVCPPFVYLDSVVEAVSGTNVGVGAQDLYPQPGGAFTGEISPAMVQDIGCKYVILGHSERRTLMGETSQMVNEKLNAALEIGLVPIVCVGELLEQRESGQTLAVIQEQFEGSFAGISAEQMGQIVIAYEPVWAIGTGKVATPEQAEEVHSEVRTILTTRYNSETAEKVRIQYGGSVKPDNAAELLAKPNIDGALVGGAALDVASFLAIVAAA